MQSGETYFKSLKNSNRAISSCLRLDSMLGIVGVAGNDIDLLLKDLSWSLDWL